MDHHSVADWDKSGVNWELTPLRFISPPTSLRETINSWVTFCCRHAAVFNLPDGELRAWLRNTQFPLQNPVLLFRNQSPLDHSAVGPGYAIWFTAVETELWLHPGTAWQLLTTFPYILPTLTWAHVRVVFWQATTDGAPSLLAIEIWVNEAGEWVQKGITYFDNINAFALSSVNRLGFTLEAQSYMDDITIWGL